MSPNVLERNALTLRGRRFAWGTRTHLMGILNLSPDSFSGDGVADTPAALERGLAQLAAGAHILDAGAESTRPGHVPVAVEEEVQRLLPALRALRAAAPDAVLSVDTYKPEVFAAAHAAGADMLNSIWGLDDALLALAAERAVPVAIMHNQRDAIYAGDVLDAVLTYLERQAQRAVRAGLPPEAVLLDPGIGFGKTPEHNLRLLANLERIVALGFPTLLGVSRKSTLGKLTGRPAGERAFATAATVALAAAAGIDVVRVHDVGAMRDVTLVADALARGLRPPGWES